MSVQGDLSVTRDDRREFGTFVNPPGAITWEEHVLVWEAYRSRGYTQSAETIAARGWFSKGEAEMLLGRPLRTWQPI